MSNKAKDKDYLLRQLRNFESEIIAEYYVDNETLLNYATTVDTALSHKLEGVKVNDVTQTINNKVAEISIPNATTSADGLMSFSDKTKLDELPFSIVDGKLCVTYYQELSV